MLLAETPSEKLPQGPGQVCQHMGTPTTNSNTGQAPLKRCRCTAKHLVL